jgi:exopolysaccharide production protein ExoY
MGHHHPVEPTEEGGNATVTTEANRHLRESTRYGAFSPESSEDRRSRAAQFPPSTPPGAVDPTETALPVPPPPEGTREPTPYEDPAMDGRRMPIETLWARFVKRTVDLAVGIPLFILFLLAYPVVGLVLKLTSPGPVLFAQVRIGRDGREITVYKFRSMYAHAEDLLRADDELYDRYVRNGFKVPPNLDPRITRIGRVLRLSSLDEVPQAICILNGSMSAVGPRPVIPEELRRLYGSSPRPYLACKPGLTGLWQVSGRSQVVYEQRAMLDSAYAAEWSLTGDLRIIARTVPVVLSADGAN